MKRPLASALGTLMAFSLAAPESAYGQSRGLDRVEELVTEGRFSSARAALQQWFDANSPSPDRSDRQRSVWLRAQLTVDPQLASLDLRRLTVEFPGGAFSDAALLRLAQMELAQENDSRALEHLRVLLRDYPGSRLRSEAHELVTQIEASPISTDATSTVR